MTADVEEFPDADRSYLPNATLRSAFIGANPRLSSFSGQIPRRVISLAIELGDFFPERRPIIPLRVGEQPGLPLVVPAIRIQSLGLFEMRNGILEKPAPI